MVIAAALGAALLFAVASVLQHRSAAEQPQEHTLRVSLLTRLVQHPVWIAGISADVAAYILQFIALGPGSLILVQTLLVSGILFALPVSGALHHRRLRRQEWVGAAATVAGLALFLVMANPGAGRDQASTLAWAVTLTAVLVPALAMVALAGPGPSIRRAVLLAGATGMAYGLSAALTKATAQLVGQGLVPLVEAWQPYALVVVGGASLLVAQSAFQAGPLRASLPILTVADPVVSIVVGALALGEGVSTNGLHPLFEIVGLVALSVGVFLLARSPLVSGEPGGGPDPPEMAVDAAAPGQAGGRPGDGGGGSHPG
ncbi:MAG: DMT family transporter [Acidimicrobiales bacterium]